MEVIPAIDLLGGKCVRLYQGDFGKVSEYDADAVAIAHQYRAAGLERLHLVDLDGAKTGEPANLGIIHTIAANVGSRLQVGGGIRSIERARALLSAGAERVVIGSVAVETPETVFAWLDELGPECVVMAFDVRIDSDGAPKVLTRGWVQDSGVSLWTLMEDFMARGAEHFLCTDISRDGTLAGANVALYRDCAQRFPGAQVIASGGVGSLRDLDELSVSGVAAVVTGKALLDGRITLEEIRKF